MNDLATKSCVPCRGGIPPLSEDERERLLGLLEQDWEIVNGHHLRRDFPFPDFVSALAFTNAIGEIAEAEGHHPNILLTWGRVTVDIWTHKIDGLTESDFILAAKIERNLAN
jgi:4a-hydroxytetrahydrobiopterin dehydratase